MKVKTFFFKIYGTRDLTTSDEEVNHFLSLFPVHDIVSVHTNYHVSQNESFDRYIVTIVYKENDLTKD